MKYLMLIVLLMLPGCSLFQSAPFSEYVQQDPILMSGYLDLGITPEMKDRLSREFRKQVDWDEYDGVSAERALGAIDAELIWIRHSLTTTGTLTYFSADESSKRLQYWTGELFTVCDQISIDGAVDEDTSLIYYFVRSRVKQNLHNLSVSLSNTEASINKKANQFQVDQFKQLAEDMIPFFSSLIPGV